MCPACGGALVGTLQVEHPAEVRPRVWSRDEEFDVVLETIDPTEALFVTSLLDSSGIPYLTRGDDPYDAFRGAFRAMVFNPNGRPVVFSVPRGLAEEARDLLGTTESRSLGPSIEEDT